MTYSELQQKLTSPIFSIIQAHRAFANESVNGVRVQLSRFTARGLLMRLKRGMFQFTDRSVDELVIAHFLYQPSYVSLETALSIHGVIPDIPAAITSVTTVTTNEFGVGDQVYRFSRIQRQLYFGFEVYTDKLSGLHYQLAQPEKALLDWMYLRSITDLRSMRIDIARLEKPRILEYVQKYPMWVRKAIDAQFASSV